MNLYFVRHGETEYNALNISQGEDTELSGTGIAQSKALARRFSKINIDLIYSSPMKRAKQTAKIINKSLKKDILYLDCLKERRAPSHFAGKRKDSTEVVNIEKLRDFHEKDPLWHYSDEENFIEYKERVKSFFSIIAKTKKENILVVSHGGPIRMIIFLMMEKEIDPRAFYRFSNLFKFDNTGITFCEKNKKGTYLVRALNDHSHLG